MFNRIIENLSNRIYKYKYSRTQADINKYVKISNSWEVSEASVKYANELIGIKGAIYNFAKKNNIHVDMFIPENEDILHVTVSKLNRRKKSNSHIKVVESLPLNSGYKAQVLRTTENEFLRQVYRVVGDLTSKIKQ